MSEPQVTLEQANEALHQLMDAHKSNGGEAQLVLPETPATEPAEPPADSPESVETAAEPAAPEAPEAVAAPPDDDDVASLRQRLTEREAAVQAAEQKFQDRLRDMQSRNQESQRILTDRHIRKSAAAAQALRILEQWKKQPEVGVPEVDVDRAIQEIKGTMNPQSASYEPPPVHPVEFNENRAIALNEFLNEKQMDAKEADEFGTWIKKEASSAMNQREQHLAERDLDGFLRLAHVRYEESLRNKANQRTSAVEAVKTVQRTQKQAAKAASATPAAPRKSAVTSATPNTIDYEKVTKDDISKWLQQTVDQHR